MSPREIKGLVISIVIILLLLTTNFTGFSGEWILALVPWVMFIPGISVATEESIKGVKFPVIFFAVACMSIGFVAGGLGIGPLITQAVTPLIQGLSTIGCLPGQPPCWARCSTSAHSAGHDGGGDRPPGGDRRQHGHRPSVGPVCLLPVL